MTPTTAIVLVAGTALTVGLGVYFFEGSKKSLPSSNVSGTGNSSKAGGGNAPSDWSSQLATLITAGAGAYNKITDQPA